MKTTLNLNDQLLRQAKKTARRQGVTLTAFMEEAIQSRIMTLNEPEKKYKFAPPIVRGTRPPAVDVSDREALYDFLDANDRG